MLEGSLPFWLEGHYDEANEDVDHEEGDDDDVDEVEKSNVSSIVVYGTVIHLVGVDWDVKNPG